MPVTPKTNANNLFRINAVARETNVEPVIFDVADIKSLIIFLHIYKGTEFIRNWFFGFLFKKYLNIPKKIVNNVKI